jgi:hypothetical protein
MLVLHPHQIKKNLPEAHLAHYTSSTGYPLTDTEALDLVQKMHLNIFGYADPISKLARERYLLIILVLNPIS